MRKHLTFDWVKFYHTQIRAGLSGLMRHAYSVSLTTLLCALRLKFRVQFEQGVRGKEVKYRARPENKHRGKDVNTVREPNDKCLSTQEVQSWHT